MFAMEKKNVYQENYFVAEKTCTSTSRDWAMMEGHTRYAVNDNESAIGDAKRCCYFTREINVSGWIDEIDQETLLGFVALIGIRDEYAVFLIKLKVHRDCAVIHQIIINFFFNKFMSR